MCRHLNGPSKDYGTNIIILWYKYHKHNWFTWKRTPTRGRHRSNTHGRPFHQRGFQWFHQWWLLDPKQDLGLLENSHVEGETPILQRCSWCEQTLWWEHPVGCSSLGTSTILANFSTLARQCWTRSCRRKNVSPCNCLWYGIYTNNTWYLYHDSSLDACFSPSQVRRLLLMVASANLSKSSYPLSVSHGKGGLEATWSCVQNHSSNFSSKNLVIIS